MLSGVQEPTWEKKKKQYFSIAHRSTTKLKQLTSEANDINLLIAMQRSATAGKACVLAQTLLHNGNDTPPQLQSKLLKTSMETYREVHIFYNQIL